MSEEQAPTLSEVFSGSSEADSVIIDEDQAPVVDETVEPVEEEAKAETEAEAAPTAEPQDTKEATVPLAALMDERTKRQAIELQLKAQAQAPVEKPDAYVTPDEAIQYGQNEIRTEFNERFLNMSEAQARSRHSEDFDQMSDVFFSEMATANPVLGQQAMQAPDPYEFVYQQAKTHIEFKGVNSVDDLKAKLEVELRAKLEAEYAEKAKNSVDQAINSALPPSLSTATATGGNTAPVWGGPPSLDSILKP